MRPFGLLRWVCWTTVGESAGFLAPIAGFALAEGLRLAPWAAYALMVLMGAVEGAILGLGQVAGLRGTAGSVPLQPWVVATGTGAVLAWSVGMLPSTLADVGLLFDLADPAVWIALGLGGLGLLASIPVAQWIVLRRTMPRAWRWIPVNMLAWLVGLIFPFLPGPFVDQRTPAAVVGGLFVVSGVAMAVTVATATGLWLRRVFPSQPAHR